MKRVNVTELQNNLPAYLGIVKAGGELLVTSRWKAGSYKIPTRL